MSRDPANRDQQGGPAASGKNQGEGDKESARRYNEEQRAFVRSARGQDAIEEAGELGTAEAREGERAEAEGRARSRGEDPAVLTRKGSDPQR